MWILEDGGLAGDRGSRRALNDGQNCLPTLDRRRASVRLRSPRQLYRAALLIAGIACLAIPRSTAWAAALQGVWLIGGKAAVQMFDCDGLLCGRIRWLQNARDPQNQAVRDKNNPEPALRQRQLCGLTIISGMRPTGPDRWEGGSFYNPDDGKTYGVSAELKSADVLVARVYAGIPALGETKTLQRIPHGTSEGWC
ncbi:DUF2147 domain-containing protein [Inquilinus sp. NPDC058860]|uniref:DUF2147 domain-containing protein n=1 Tax=Inquilinus sp. NPDC058860 TaxID=3346652 RepID=UPI0036C5A7A6